MTPCTASDSVKQLADALLIHVCLLPISNSSRANSVVHKFLRLKADKINVSCVGVSILQMSIEEFIGDFSSIRRKVMG